jgi:hypothetical protein
MIFQANNIRLQYTESGNAEIVLSTTEKRIDVSKLKEIVSKGKLLKVEIKEYRKNRSLDANAYLWVLCQKLAEALNATKEEIYREAVRKVGQFEFIAVREDAAETFVRAWNSKGLGWYAEEIPDCKVRGCKKIIVYYGSSVYDTKAMSVLIDYIVQECKEQDIETMPEQELKTMIEQWDDKEG